MLGLLTAMIAAAPSASAVRIIEAHKQCNRGDESACQLALELYPPYLAVHSADFELQFFYAELLWNRDRFIEAAERYHFVARNAELGFKFTKNAAYNEILALEKTGPRSSHRYDGQPWPLSVEGQRLIDAIDFHLARWPSERDQELNRLAISIFMEADDFAAAERRISTLKNQGQVDVLLEDLDTLRNSARDPIGSGAPIGNPQTIGSPQTIGACSDDECPIEEVGDVEVERCGEIRFNDEEIEGD
ncbi:MAG: hypothetical protein JNM17_01325 [Archangium sp.]|nr:hypothetical protein [Archangium sp.]